MQLFNKKGGGGAGGLQLQPWHPNFRNTAELPDIKTVRTKFFVNTACVILAVGALLGWLYTEYTIRTTNQQLAAVEQQVAHDSKGSREAIAHYKKFKDDEGKVTELFAFLDGQKILLSDFIIKIGQNVPEHVTLTSIQMRNSDMSVKGIVKSLPEKASTIASAYEKQLHDNKDLTKIFSSISLTSLSRDSATGFLNFEMIFKFNK